METLPRGTYILSLSTGSGEGIFLVFGADEMFCCFLDMIPFLFISSFNLLLFAWCWGFVDLLHV